MKFSLLNRLLWSIFVFALISWFSLIYLHHTSSINNNSSSNTLMIHHHHQQQYQYHKKKKEKQKKKNYEETAAICAVVKDEDRYLEEWLLYHLGLGFDKIYLYDDSPNTTTVRWVQNYCNNNKKKSNNNGGGGGGDGNGSAADDDEYYQTMILEGTTVTPFYNDTTSNQRQHAAYRDCIKKNGNQHKWIGFIDVDEFIVLYQDDNIIQMLQKHCKKGSLALHWKMFGTSGHKTYYDALVTERFQLSTNTNRDFIKTIVHVVDYKDFQNSPHWVSLNDDNYRLDTSGEWVELARRYDNPKLFGPKRKRRKTNKGKNDKKSLFPFDVAAIYHYKYKSIEEFHWKRCERGDIYNFQLCHKERYNNLPIGNERDDTAYQLLLKNVPKYGNKNKKNTRLNDNRNFIFLRKTNLDFLRFKKQHL